MENYGADYNVSYKRFNRYLYQSHLLHQVFHVVVFFLPTHFPTLKNL